MQLEFKGSSLPLGQYAYIATIKAKRRLGRNKEWYYLVRHTNEAGDCMSAEVVKEISGIDLYPKEIPTE